MAFKDKFLTDEQFRDIFKNRPDQILASPVSGCRSFDILVRLSDKQEFSKPNGLLFSEGGTSGSGDIIVRSYHNSPSDFKELYIFIGAKFELQDPIASSLRKSVYDAVFDYPGSHKNHLWRAGKRGSPFDEPTDSTPFIEIPMSSNWQNSLQNTFENAVKYLRIIDSEEFDQAVREMKKVASDIISPLLRSSMLTIDTSAAE